jgi:CarD family transcriptional regulator
MFKVGDLVFHPANGAGIVMGKTTRLVRSKPQHYYTIKVLEQTKTSLMIPVDKCDSVGLRQAISPSQIEQVWEVLDAPPQTLPDQDKARYKLTRDKLQTGNTLEIAEVTRDLAWRQRQRDRLNIPGEKLYKKSLELLASEVATVQGIELKTAKLQIKKRLQESFTAHALV